MKWRATRQLHFDDYRRTIGRGGPRPGAGRPRGPRPRVHHVRRDPVRRDHPSHVTVRIRRGIPSLRRRRFVAEFRRSLAKASDRGDFRVVHYSIQRDHVHMIVEAAGRRALASGMKSISARIARAVHRAYDRTGRVLDGRYHLRALKTPREVRNALAYVLLNARKHWRQRHGVPPPVRTDEASSGRWFDGWRGAIGRPRAGPREVPEPHTWLLRRGWRRRGLVGLAEVPG